jgi:hypothetical protein
MTTNEELPIRDAATEPKSATIDGNTVSNQPLRDQIEADKYLAAKRTASAGGLGIRTLKLSPPGTV